MRKLMTLIANRYEVLKELGRGGMGAVYHVQDRLTNETSALKQVLIPTNKLEFNLSNSSQSQYLALATEFRTLATLRHPNIIGVQDYGFDTNAQPYFTMEYLPGATAITSYAAHQPDDVKVRLLTEMLQALAYLHQRGIIHRDIKPSNVLVDQHGTVKVLDFGLAINLSPDDTLESQDKAAGTVAYMAPELFGGSPSVQSDLYAVGMIAYEMFAGLYPFDSSSFMTLLDDILRKQADMTLIQQPSVAVFVEQLIAKAPELRLESARRTIRALYNAFDQPPPEESTIIRESFLQASTFVGRRQELETFKAALQQLKTDQHSSAWLLGGESGSGKSRLVEEVRARAMVEGVRVLRGQAAEGGLSYQLWRDILRPLVLQTDLSDTEAGILKEIVPDIASLLQRKIPNIASLKGEANQERLALTIAEVFERQNAPVMLVLEDLHWAEHSLVILQTLLPRLSGLKLLIIGTYRTDEMPQLPAQLPAINIMKLARLSEDSISELSRSMLGEAAHDAQLLALLTKETEGNVFFIVEVVRALAEEAGSLTDIGKTELPQRVMAGGIQQVLRRRLARMPAWAQPLLKLAAVAGRQLDQAVLAAATPNTNIDEFVTEGANAAIFDVVDGNWRFAHDKLRETLLENLAESEKPALYRRVAEGIEAIYPDNNAYAEILAQHWDKAGNTAKTVAYTVLASQRILDSTAEYEQAHLLLFRALELAAENTDTIALLHYLVGEIYMRQASYDDAFAHYEQCLAVASTDQELTVRTLLGMGNIKAQQGQLDLTEQYIAQAVAIMENVDNQALRADVLIYQGRLADTKGDYEQAHQYFEQSLLLDTNLRRELKISTSLIQLGGIALRRGELDKAEAYFERSLKIQRGLQDKYNIAVSLGNLGFVALLKSDYDRAQLCIEESLELHRSIGSRYGESMALIDLGSIAGGRGLHNEAIAYFEQSLAISREIGDQESIVISLNEQANLFLTTNDTARARTNLYKSLKLAQEAGAIPYLLTAFVLVARLYFVEGKLLQSAMLAGFCAVQETMPADERGRYLEPLQATLQAQMRASDYQEALQAGKAQTRPLLFEELVAELATAAAETLDTASGDTTIPADVSTAPVLAEHDIPVYLRELHQLMTAALSGENKAGPDAEPQPALNNLITKTRTALLEETLTEATALFSEATALISGNTSNRQRSLYLQLQSHLAAANGEFDNAYGYLQQRLALERTQQHSRAIAECLFEIGLIQAYQHHYLTAQEHFEQSLAASQSLNAALLLAFNLTALAIIAAAQGQVDTAQQHLQNSLPHFKANAATKAIALVEQLSSKISS